MPNSTEMKAPDKKSATLQAVGLGHEPGQWRLVQENEANLYGFTTYCRGCWRDMVVVYRPERATTGPMLEEQCDWVGGPLGQQRLPL